MEAWRNKFYFVFTQTSLSLNQNLVSLSENVDEKHWFVCMVWHNCLFKRNPSKEEVVINHYDAYENNGDNEDEDIESFEDEDEDSFDEVDANLKSKPAAAVTKARVHSPYMGSSGKPPVSPANFRDSQYVTERQGSEEDDDEDDFAVSESSQWDSGGYIIF